MPTHDAARAIEDALRVGKALLKFISPNDAGITGSHQAGFYLPKSAWPMYTPDPPKAGVNSKHWVAIRWPDGRKTDSVVTWYGRGTRSEYRLTRFGSDFPFLTTDAVGALLVLVPMALDDFRAYVLDLDDDIDDFHAALGVETYDGWGVYDVESPHVESEDECLHRKFMELVDGVHDEFPSIKEMSRTAREGLDECIERFAILEADQKLLQARETEYELFKLVEKLIYGPMLLKPLESIDAFLQIANSITNRRKSRAGASFENQISFVFRDAQLPFDEQSEIDGQVVDFLIPGVEEYNDLDYPDDRLFVVDAKTTTKDRWRQVIASKQSRVPRRHLMTLHPAISSQQFMQMRDADVSLVVPKALHRGYPADCREKLLGVEQFIEMVAVSLQ